MSKELIDRWLDNEVDDQSKLQLEAWLSDDPDNLQSYFDAVQLQEDLRGHYGKATQVVPEPSQNKKRTQLIVALSAVAAVIVAGLFIAPRLSAPHATNDPLVWVLSGNPQVDITRVHPGPNPVPIPREHWPMATRVSASDEPCSLRWDEGCVLEVSARASVTLRSSTDNDMPVEPRSIHMESGSLTVRLESPGVPVDIFVGDAQVRASQPADFMLRDSGPQPAGGGITLSVTRGEVLLLLGAGITQSVTAGEDVALP